MTLPTATAHRLPAMPTPWLEIVLDVSRKTGIQPAEIASRARFKHIMSARREVFYRIRTERGASYPAIGRAFGFDHTSVLHACRKAEKND